MAAGVERVFVYPLVESPFGSDADLALLDGDGTPRPAAAALATLAAEVGDRRHAYTVELNGRRAWLFSREGEDALAVIVADGLAPLTVEARWPASRDVYGNALAAGDRARVIYLCARNITDAERALVP
jgi:hypothetical protein